jgi:hypothetical protein
MTNKCKKCGHYEKHHKNINMLKKIYDIEACEKFEELKNDK